MGYGFKVEIRGDYALFSRPELKVERVSYEVITPSAARGILEAVMWKPAIRYRIDEIAVCSPIRFENIRRNEVAFKAAGMTPKAAAEERQQRSAMVLRDVRYVVTAHFEMTDKAGALDNEGKFTEMIRRRLEKGQNFHTPYLGAREFPAEVRLIADGEIPPEPIGETRPLGLMLYDIDYVAQTRTASGGSETEQLTLYDSGHVTQTGKDAVAVIKEFKPLYFMAEMKNGVIDLREAEVLR